MKYGSQALLKSSPTCSGARPNQHKLIVIMDVAKFLANQTFRRGETGVWQGRLLRVSYSTPKNNIEGNHLNTRRPLAANRATRHHTRHLTRLPAPLMHPHSTRRRAERLNVECSLNQNKYLPNQDFVVLLQA